MTKANDKLREFLLLGGVLTFAYLLRSFYLDIFIICWDLPQHIGDSMRLHSATFSFTGNINYNFFYQLFVNQHGYTTALLPYILYEFFFHIVGITITEKSLTLVHNCIGIFSLGAIYFFIRQHFNRNMSLFTLLLVSVIPIHVGLSRAHVGFQIIQLIFFYLSLSFLHQLIHTPRQKTKYLYFLSTFFYIGCDNAFYIGIFLHLIYIFLFLPQKDISQFWQKLQTIYFSPLTILFIILPIAIYISLTYGCFQITYILKNASKESNLGPLLRYPIVCFGLIGPSAIVFLIQGKNIFRRNILPIHQYCLIHCAIYLTLLAIFNVNAAYILYILVPLAIMTVALIPNSKVLTGITILGSFLFTLGTIYNIDIGLPTRFTYGSHYINPDNGAKTLGYLIRSKTLDISTELDDNGVPIQHINLYIGQPSIFYYLGTFRYFSLRHNLGLKGSSLWHHNQENFALAHWTNFDPDSYYWQMTEMIPQANKEIETYVSQKQIPVWGYITNGSEKVLTLYSNQKRDVIKSYDIGEYNKKFDDEYGRMESFSFFRSGYDPFRAKKI